MKHKDYDSLSGRRQFLSAASGLVGTSILMTLPGLSGAGVVGNFNGKAGDRYHPERNSRRSICHNGRSVKVWQYGAEVTGIVTTMFPTIEVIEQTAKAGANFIIAHETPFYNNQDETEWLQQDDAYRYKIDLLNKHKIAIWRFHDYWHSHKPDGIIMGNLIKLGWEKYYDANSPRLLTLPKPMTLKSIVTLAKQRLGIPTVRVIGDLNQNCSTIYLAFGYMDSKRQIAAIQEFKPDLILSGETREWETVERVRDGRLMGQKTSLLVLSHAVSEEAGMEYAAKWLQPKVPDLKITHIASTNPFTFL